LPSVCQTFFGKTLLTWFPDFYVGVGIFFITIPKIHQDNERLVLGFCNVALWNPQDEFKTMRFSKYHFYFYCDLQLLQKYLKFEL
jgi:hypothetical protein